MCPAAQQVAAGDVLSGPFWPEAVRVLSVRALGARTCVESVGTLTGRFYAVILSDEDVARVTVLPPARWDLRGDPEAFFLGMEAHRVRFAQQFDPLFAVNVSQIDPLPHQIEAVYHYILRSPRIRFLLADDPGAGKTIMAGLVLKELKYRGLVRRTLIVVPGHLKDQWVREMKDRFGEAFVVVDRGVMNATWGLNVWQEQSQVITSMDFGKQQDVMAALAETRWDLVIVDEAHKMAAYRYGTRTEKTDRYRLGELLARRTQYLLFLTATPHRGNEENFRLFLDLLEPGLFANTGLLSESIRNRDNPLFLRRLKEDLKDFNQRPLFPHRHPLTRPYRLNDDEKRLYNAVTEYVQTSYNRALAEEKRNVAFALLILQRRLASSVRAVRRSLERRKARLEELLSIGKWLVDTDRFDEEELEDAPEEERMRLEDELVERLTASVTRQELQQEIETLEGLIRLAREAERHEIETKLGELREVMDDQRLRERKEKLLIFTEFRDTLDYLAEKLRKWGYSVVTLHGGMSLDARIRAEHEFRENAQVMVSTEAGGEGINLQFCSLMVNYDIPWNPNRLEQRMGRIHRYGQQREVYIYNLVASDTREGMVLRTLFDKLKRIQDAMRTDRVFDVIGELTPGRSLRDLIVEAIAQRRSLDEILAEIEAVPDAEAIRRTREAALEALATRHIDLQRILGEDRQAREHRLVPEYIERFFIRGCRFLNVPLERRRDNLWRISHVPYELRNVPQEFKLRFGEVFSGYQKFCFDKETARRQDALFVAPGHPLLETIVEALLSRCQEHLERGAVFEDPDGNLDGWLWFVEGELRDGEQCVAGKRLFAIYQPVSSDALQLVNSSMLWDLKPSDQRPEEGCPEEGPVLAFVAEKALDKYRAELLEQRLRDAEIKRKYGLRSLEQMIAECQAKLIDYYTRRSQGYPITDREIASEEQRRRELEERKQQLQREIERETTLTPSVPRVLGVVRIVPRRSGDDQLTVDPEIEAVGMRIAIEYEKSQGRIPEDVSELKLGYDIRSQTAEGTVRYIEVKARAGTGQVILTPNEWLMAQRLGEDYWLYVVENACTAPQLYLIQNPAAKLTPDEEVEVVRLVLRDWRAHGVRASLVFGIR